jgi:hypothetical protein
MSYIGLDTDETITLIMGDRVEIINKIDACISELICAAFEVDPTATEITIPVTITGLKDPVPTADVEMTTETSALLADTPAVEAPPAIETNKLYVSVIDEIIQYMKFHKGKKHLVITTNDNTMATFVYHLHKSQVNVKGVDNVAEKDKDKPVYDADAESPDEEYYDVLEKHIKDECKYIRRPIVSKQLKDSCLYSEDAEMMERIYARGIKYIYDFMLSVHYLGIPALIHLAAAKIACIVKGEEKIIIERLIDPKETRTREELIAAYPVAQ